MRQSAEICTLVTTTEKEQILYFTALEQMMMGPLDGFSTEQLSEAVQKIIAAHRAAVALEVDRMPLRDMEEGVDPSLPDGLNYLIRQDNQRIREEQQGQHEAAVKKLFTDIGIINENAREMASIARDAGKKKALQK